MKNERYFVFNILLFSAFISLLGSFACEAYAERGVNALVYIDDPEADVQATDSVSVLRVNKKSGSVEMEEIGFLDAGHMVSLATKHNPNGGIPTLVKHKFDGIEGEYYEIPIGNHGSDEKLYLNKEDIDVRGFLTGARNSKNLLKESLATPTGFGSVRVLTQAPDKCSGDKCSGYTIDGSQDIIVSDSQFFLVTEPDGKKVYRNYLLAKTPEGQGPFWIEAELTAIRETDYQDPDKNCEECLGANDPIKDVIDAAKDLKEKAESDQMTGVVDQLLPFVGQCYRGDRFSSGQDYVKNVLPKLNAGVSVGGRKLTKDQVAAIDLLSRTIYGEMASCNRHGPQYLNTVGRVVLNRVQYIRDEGRRFGSEFGNESLSGVAPPFGEVILRPQAFSLWNKNDPAGKNAFCPANPKFDDSKESTVNGGRRHFQPAVNAYRKAVEVAAKAVLNQDQLKRDTAGVKHLFYTSAISQGKGFVETKNISTPLGPIKNPSCVRLWASKPIRQRMQRASDPLKYGGLLLEFDIADLYP